MTTLVTYVDSRETARVKTEGQLHAFFLIIAEVEQAGLVIEEDTYRAPDGRAVKFVLEHEEGSDDTSTE